MGTIARVYCIRYWSLFASQKTNKVKQTNRQTNTIWDVPEFGRTNTEQKRPAANAIESQSQLVVCILLGGHGGMLRKMLFFKALRFFYQICPKFSSKMPPFDHKVSIFRVFTALCHRNDSFKTDMGTHLYLLRHKSYLNTAY